MNVVLYGKDFEDVISFLDMRLSWVTWGPRFETEKKEARGEQTEGKGAVLLEGERGLTPGNAAPEAGNGKESILP